MNKVKVEGEGQDDAVTSGCPSLGLPRIPSGADGTEPLVRTDYEDVIADVFHKCNEAFIQAPQQREARPVYFKSIVGDLAAALASVVPGEKVKVEGEGEQRKKHDPSEYWKVAEGVQLTRYKGTNVTRLIAVRKGLESNPDFVYEISVDHDNATAVIERDGEMMYKIRTLGLSHRRCIHAAIQVLRSHLHENDGVHRRHNKRRVGILTPEQELSETVKRQKEEN